MRRNVPVSATFSLSRTAQFLMGALFTVTSVLMPTQQSQALEYANGGKIINASLNTAVSNPQANIGLFGAAEQRHTDTSAFTKWHNSLAKFKKNLMGSLDQKPVQDWLFFLDSLKSKSKAAQIEAVNQYMNRIKFVSDANNYGTNDYWATPMEFLARGGDCEDYAMAKYVSLRALGFTKQELRMAIVNDRVMRTPHATLIVYHDNKAKVLDNQNPAILNSAEISRYVPVYSISQLAWWRH